MTWQERITHVNRQRLGQALCDLLHAASSPSLHPYAVSRVAVVAGSGCRRMTIYVTNPVSDRSGRGPGEIQLLVRDELQSDDRIAWQATVIDSNQAIELGQVVWEPDLAPDPNEYHFNMLDPSDSAFGRPDRGRRRDSLTAFPRRAAGAAAALAASADRAATQQRAIMEAEDAGWVREDDQAGTLFGAGAGRVVARYADPHRPDFARVREFFRRHEHFHLLDASVRARAYALLGLAQRQERNGTLVFAEQTNNAVETLVASILPLSVEQIEARLIRVLVDEGELDADLVDDPEFTAGAVAASLVDIAIDRGATERRRYTIGCLTRVQLREQRRHRYGSSSAPMNPCGEILLGGEPQVDVLTAEAARQARARDDEADARIMAAVTGVLGHPPSFANIRPRAGGVLTINEQRELAQLTLEDVAPGVQPSGVGVDFSSRPGFIRPPVEVFQEIPPPITAGTTLRQGADGNIEVCPVGEPHSFVACGPVDADGQVEVQWVNGSRLRVALGERFDAERIRGLRANAIVIDDSADMDPELAAEALRPSWNEPVRGERAPDVRAAQLARQRELADDLKRIASQMFDPGLDDSRLTGQEMAVAHLRYRLKVLLTTVPIGRLTADPIFEDDAVLDVVFRDSWAGGAEVVRVRMDDPDVLSAATERIPDAELVATGRAIDL